MLEHLFIKQTKTLKEALYDTIHYSDIPPKLIAERLGIALSYLYRAATPDADTDGPDATGVRFPTKHIVPLTLITGDYQVLDLMNYQAGRVAVPLPQPEKFNVDGVLSAALKAAVEFGEFAKEVHESIEDGTIKAHEQERIDKEGLEAIQAIMTLMTSYKSK